MNDNSNILIRRGPSEPWTAPESSSYNDEKQLQEVIAASPHWVPGVPEGAFTVRESYTQAGPVDVMVVSPDGKTYRATASRTLPNGRLYSSTIVWKRVGQAAR